MLWQGALDDARRMLPLVEDGIRAAAEARIALQSDAKDVTAKLKAVPAKSAGSAGLAYDRFRWRISRDLYPDAIALLIERSTSAKALGYPAEWADWRRKLARKEMREGDPRRAYRLASQHFLTEGDDYEDLEWLAGYIALVKLGDGKAALAHFDRFAAAVNGPISLGRAGYWRGRALEQLGRKADAQAAYAEGARYQTSFYGILSAEKVGLPLSPALAGGEAYPDWNLPAITGSSVFQAGRLLLAAGERPLAARFFLQMTESMSGQEIGRLAGMATQLTAHHGAFFAALADATAEPPSHVVIDLTMPGMPGEEVLRQLAVLQCRARVVVCSGADPERMAAAAVLADLLGLRFVGTLSKPFAPAALRRLLQS